jgi:hypothetical protein
MVKRLAAMAFTLFFIQATVAATAAAQTAIRTQRVRFDKGASSAVIKGQVKGYADVDYLVGAGAGQTITVSLKPSNRSNYFNVLPPGSKDVAMHVGQTGDDYTGVLPTDGDYTVRVYLVRAAARRNETSTYTLTVSVSGKALKPTPAAVDAVIPGTAFHASAPITCLPYIATLRDKQPRQCQAFVIRRGFDGTATVEIPQENSIPRRILFVKGQPVASDASFPMAFSRKDYVTIVTFDTGERYEIPDMLVFGG